MMEVKGKTKEIREIGRGDKKGKSMMLVKMESKKGKRGVMRKENKLKERTERIQDDWTWKERAMQWRLEKIAWEKRKKVEKCGCDMEKYGWKRDGGDGAKRRRN